MHPAAADHSVALAFGGHFGMNRQEAHALALLYRAAPDAIPAPAFVRALGTTSGALSVCVHRLRRALEVEAINFENGRGYRLTEVGVSECRLAIRALVAELADAA